MKSDTEKLLRTREMHKLIKMAAAVGAAGIMGSAGWVAAAELSPSTDRPGIDFPIRLWPSQIRVWHSLKIGPTGCFIGHQTAAA